MQASYHLTEKDLIDAQISHAGRTFRALQLLGAFSVAAGLGAVVLAGARYYQALVPIALGLFFLFHLHLSAKLSFKRDFVSQGNVEVATSQSGIRFLSAKGTVDLNWNAFTRYTETKHLFMLYPQSNMFLIVPKQALAPEDLTEFRQVLEQNVAAKSASYARRFSPKLIVFLTVVCAVAILLGVVLVRSRG